MDCTICLVSRQLLNYANVQTHFIRQRDLNTQEMATRKIYCRARSLQCLQCTAYLSDTMQGVKRSGTPDLEVKSSAINWQRHDNAKVQTTKTGRCIAHRQQYDEIPAATIKLSLAALQMCSSANALCKVYSTRLHANSISRSHLSRVYLMKPSMRLTTHRAMKACGVVGVNSRIHNLVRDGVPSVHVREGLAPE